MYLKRIKNGEEPLDLRAFRGMLRELERNAQIVSFLKRLTNVLHIGSEMLVKGSHSRRQNAITGQSCTLY